MGTRDRRIDAYIAKSAGFARPVLTHLREVVHEACPDVEEAIKWGFPFFLRRGALFCYMASFTKHAAFGFRRGALVTGKGKVPEKAMGQFGRITGIRDLPPRKTLLGYVKKAAALHDAELMREAKPKPEKKKLAAVPADLRAALKKNGRARSAFEGFSPSQRREYVEWILEAKREETRQRRIATALAWIAEGKTQSWRYEK